MNDVKPDAKRVSQLMPLIDDVQKKSWAKNKASEALRSAESKLRQEVGNGHEFTNVMCRVNKIGGHIYYPDTAYAGIGKRHCILCGLDDFDF